MSFEVINGDCLVEMPKLMARGVTVDACITDPPYGTTACAWDAVIPFEPMWANLKQLVKRDGAIVLFGSQPFTTALNYSNLGWFRYEWIWQKQKPTNFYQARLKPLKEHENISVFSEGATPYNPQDLTAVCVHSGRTNKSARGVYRPYGGQDYVQTQGNFPRSILRYETVPDNVRVHENEKPVELMRYLVRTYTNPGDTVLDFTAGSFTTGVACVIEGRNFIGIEQSADYCRIGEARLKRASGIPADIPRLNRRQIETPLFGGAA